MFPDLLLALAVAQAQPSGSPATPQAGPVAAPDLPSAGTVQISPGRGGTSPSIRLGRCDAIYPPLAQEIAFDPKTTLTVGTSEQFIIGLRAVHDAGYHWRSRTPVGALLARGSTPAQYLGTVSISDAQTANMDRGTAQPPVVGGRAVELYLFRAVTAGNAQLSFDYFGPGRKAPDRSVTFNVKIEANRTTC